MPFIYIFDFPYSEYEQTFYTNERCQFLNAILYPRISKNYSYLYPEYPNYMHVHTALINFSASDNTYHVSVPISHDFTRLLKVRLISSFDLCSLYYGNLILYHYLYL